jgi:UDP-N-acetylglucosamine:LPS N-acetylglucosamine transferase
MELFGGKGSAEMRPLTEALLTSLPDAHVIAVCGDNPALVESMAPLAAAGGGRLHALGFTRRIADYLSASDLLVTKPGPGSLAEAFQQRVPVVVTSHARTIPQERWNAELVRSLDLGRVVGSVEELPAAVVALRNDAAAWGQVQANLRALPPNRAVYEVLDLVAAELRRVGALTSS